MLSAVLPSMDQCGNFLQCCHSYSAAVSGVLGTTFYVLPPGVMAGYYFYGAAISRLRIPLCCVLSFSQLAWLVQRITLAAVRGWLGEFFNVRWV